MTVGCVGGMRLSAGTRRVAPVDRTNVVGRHGLVCYAVTVGDIVHLGHWFAIGAGLRPDFTPMLIVESAL